MSTRLTIRVSMLCSVLLSASALCQQAASQLLLHVDSSLMVQGGEGSVSCTLYNQGDAALPLSLSASPVTDLVSSAVMSKTHILLTPLGSAYALSAPAPQAASIAGKPTASPKVELPKSIAAHETLWFQASATGVSTTSSGFTLLNGNTRVGEVTLVATDAPLNISLDGENATEHPLAYTLQSPVTIALKNSDPQPYDLSWDLRIDGSSQCSGKLKIAASGSARIIVVPGLSEKAGAASNAAAQQDLPCTANRNVFSLFDYIHPAAKRGELLLSVVGPEGTSPALLPSRSLPVSLLMLRTGVRLSTACSYLCAIFFLFIGGFLSFLASSVLPAVQKKANLRDELQQLRSRTTTVSNRVDSYLRVLLRLERSRIADTIDHASSWIPATADQVALAASSIAILTKRLSAAERLDDLRRKHDIASVTAPPSVTDGIDASLQSAAQLLQSFALSDTDLAAANIFFARAKAALDMLSDTEALAKLIAGNVASLQTRLAKFPPNYYADLKAALPGVWVIADSTRDFDDARNVTRSMLFAIDHGSAAIQLALDYAMVRASIPHRPTSKVHLSGDPSASPLTGSVPANAPEHAETRGSASTALTGNAVQANLVQGTAPVDPLCKPDVLLPADAEPLVPAFTARECTALGLDTRERLLKHQCKLIELLGTLSWRALRDASLLVQEMREDIYEEDILAEIKKPGQAEITFDTQRTRPFSPVFFNIVFRDASLNNTAASQRLICHWCFPDRLEEHSWKVCHYFTGKEQTYGSPPIESFLARPHATHAGTPPSPSQAIAPASTPPPFQPTPEPESSSSSRSFWTFGRNTTKPAKCDLTIYATIRGQRMKESQEVPLPPLTQVIHLDMALSGDRARYAAEGLRFAIAFGVALAGLLSGALDQLNKLDFLPAATAIVGLGFTANSVKNLLTQSAAPTPTPAGPNSNPHS